MTKEDKDDITKLQLQLQIAEAKNRGEAMKEMDAGQKCLLSLRDEVEPTILCFGEESKIMTLTMKVPEGEGTGRKKTCNE